MSGSEAQGRQKDNLGYVYTALALALSEVLGTALLLFLGCMGGIPGLTPQVPQFLQHAIAFGLTVMLAIQIFGHISGAHINPAVTCSAWVWGAITLPHAVMYIISQFIGAVLGYGALLTLAPREAFFPQGEYSANSTHGFCVTRPNPLISPMQALIAEFGVTSILILLCCGLWDKRNSTKQDGTPLKFGFAITCIALSEGALTGASMNPARSFAPALFTGVWEAHWIYWLGPFVAGFLVTYIYKFAFDRTAPEEENDPTTIPLNKVVKTIVKSPISEKNSTESLPNV